MELVGIIYLVVLSVVVVGVVYWWYTDARQREVNDEYHAV